MKKEKCGKASSAIPAYPGNKGTKQSSGKTKHARMRSEKVENLSGMPTVHQ